MKRRSIGPGVSFFAFQDIITAVVGIFILITLILVLELAQRVEAASSRPTIDVEQVHTTIASLAKEVEQMQAEYDRRIADQSDVAGLNQFNRDAKIAELRAATQSAAERLANAREQIHVTEQSLKQAQKTEATLLQQAAALEDDRELLAELRQELDELGRRINEIESDNPLIYRDQTADGRLLTLLLIRENEIELRDALTQISLRWTGLARMNQFRSWLDSNGIGSRHFLLLIRPGGAGDYQSIRKDLEEADAAFGFDVVGGQRSIRLGFEVEAVR